MQISTLIAMLFIIFLCPNRLLNLINLIDFSALFLIHLNTNYDVF